MYGSMYGMVPMTTASSRDGDLRAYSRWEYGDADTAWIARAARIPRTPVWPRVRRRVRGWLASIRRPLPAAETGAED